MAVFEKIRDDNYEQIIFCNDQRVGLKAIIAIHNSALGPATGGCRMWNYRSEDEALTDVLRLSKGMTYKAAISNLALGGGKSVIMGDTSIKTPELLKRFGDFVQGLNGSYITAKDVGIDSNDLKIVKTRTTHILGIAGEANSSGDPSPLTAWGIFNGMKACAEKAFGTNKLSGLKIALQGLGAVNYYLCQHLHKEGAILFGCDINKEAVERARAEFNLQIVGCEQIYDTPCDIFSPGALGAILNAQTMSRLKCKVIAGAANNQLATEQDGDALFKQGLVYAPDYAINAGGLINISLERAGYNKDHAYAKTAQIYDTIKMILERSSAEKLPTNVVANRIAQERVSKAHELRLNS
jgi:leucine dehydrogenase